MSKRLVLVATNLRPVMPKGRDADAMQSSISSDAKLNKCEEVMIMIFVSVVEGGRGC